MACLVVEEKIGLELAQEFALGQATEEHRLVDLDVPIHQGADGTFVRRRAARCHQGGADAHVVRRLALQAVQRLEQRLEWPRRQRRRRVQALMVLEGDQPVALVHAFGLVGKQHRIAVERDADFGRMQVGGARAVRHHARRRHASVER